MTLSAASLEKLPLYLDFRIISSRLSRWVIVNITDSLFLYGQSLTCFLCWYFHYKPSSGLKRRCVTGYLRKRSQITSETGFFQQNSSFTRLVLHDVSIYDIKEESTINHKINITVNYTPPKITVKIAKLMLWSQKIGLKFLCKWIFRLSFTSIYAVN